MAKCFYCLHDRKLTRAHLFQRGFRDALEGDSGTTYLSAASASREGVYRDLSYPQDMREAKVTSLCGDCNAGWMQRVEVAAAPVFRDVIGGKQVPPPHQLFDLAHWSVILGALSSELFPTIEIPEHQRSSIRSSTGHPHEFSTYVVWTGDVLRSVQIDLYRGVSYRGDVEEVHWVSVVHAGAAVLMSGTPSLLGRIPRLLDAGGVPSTLGFVGETAVYVPEQFHTSMRGSNLPSHVAVREIGRRILGEPQPFVTTPTGREMLDLSGGIDLQITDLSFDFAGRLFDRRRLRGR